MSERRDINIPKRLDDLRVEGVIDPDNVDYVFANPEALRKELAPALNYFGRVEREVERNVLELELLLPDADENNRTYYDLWSAQEIPHGLIFEEIERRLEIPPADLNLNQVSKAIKLGGHLAHIPKIHDVLMHTYLVTGAQHEKLTAKGYVLLRQRLMRLGEAAIVSTAIDPIRRQEGMHFAYYRDAALLQQDQLSDWQLHLSQIMRKRTYAPVGAGNKRQKAQFGHTAAVLLGGDTQDPEFEEKLEKFAAPVQAVAQELLVREKDGLKVPLFVIRALRESVELYRSQQASLEEEFHDRRGDLLPE